MSGTPGKTQRWYLGGIGGSMAVCFTHPLDTVKVHLQTHKGKLSGLQNGLKFIIRQVCFSILNVFLMSVQINVWITKLQQKIK